MSSQHDKKKRKQDDTHSSKTSSSMAAAAASIVLATPSSKIINEYSNELQAIKDTLDKYWSSETFFHDKNKKSIDIRRENFSYLDKYAQDLIDKYAWACPDDRALRIIATFSPLIEIGSGKGYWVSLLRNHFDSVDVIAADKYVAKKSFTTVVKGGPEILKNKKSSMVHDKPRTLLLCYPDEQEAIASQCLDYYTGEYIIHIGESLVGAGTLFGVPQAPFGRTSSADFQVSLSEMFHQVLVCDLHNRLPYSRDCISVWKRTAYVQGKDHAESIDSNNDAPVTQQKAIATETTGKSKKAKKEVPSSSSSSSAVETISLDQLAMLREVGLDMQYSEDKESLWAYIPENEILPVDRAAACLAHML